MRNNEDRIGVKNIQSGDEVALQATQNQGLNLNFINPTEFVDLPSKGKYYPEGHPLNGRSSIEIKQMTAKEEDILTNKSYLKKGIALEKLLEALIVDKSINPGHLLIADRNAIFLSARISAYGNDYTTQVVCPACEKKSKYSFDLLEKVAVDFDEEENTELPEVVNGTFKLNLPNTKWVVECRPLNGFDEKKLFGTLSNKSKEEFTLFDQLKMLVVSIQGITDRTTIEQAVSKMPASDSRYIRKQYEAIIPSIDLKGTFECKECTYEEVLEVPLTAEFFWPK